MIDNAYHWKFGRHSNIPDCCILYWLTEWDNARNAQNRHWKRVIRAYWNYVPCPECLRLKRKIRLVECELECGGEHQKDFES